MSAIEGTSAVSVVGRCIRHRPCPTDAAIGHGRKGQPRRVDIVSAEAEATNDKVIETVDDSSELIRSFLIWVP
jgi:hypothetical protein